MNMGEKEKEFLFFYMDQSCQEMRHLEKLRERVSVLIITIASIIAGFVVQQGFSTDTKLMIWLIIALGIVGILMVSKIFQLHQMCQYRLNNWYKYLEKACGKNSKVLLLKYESDTKNREDFKILSKIPHNLFWIVLNVLVISIGIVMLSLVKPNLSTLPDEVKIVEPIIEKVVDDNIIRGTNEDIRDTSLQE